MLVNLGGLETGFERARQEEVVDTPTDVVFSSFTPMRPPSIALGPGMERAEAIQEAGLQEVSDSLSFFVRKAGGVMIGLWAGEVDFLMRGVEIAASYDGLFLF